MNSKIDSPIKLYFYKWLKGGKKTIKVPGITLTPEYDEYSDMIYWTMDNPNKSSYSSFVLNGYIEESLHDFSKLTNQEFFNLLKNKQKLETPYKIYLNPEDENKFLELAQQTTQFKYKELKMDIHAFDIDTRMDRDGVYFTISVMCFNPYDTVDLKKLTYTELKDRLDYYKEWDSYFDYTDNLFDTLSNYIWNDSPSLFDNSYMLVQGGIRYFTPDRKEIKIW